MFRSVALLIVVLASPSTLTAAETEKLSVVAATPNAAAMLPPLPQGSRMVVLLENDGDSIETINRRALSMKDATHFVYLPGDESILTAMYRERLQSRGAVPVALPQPVQQRHASVSFTAFLTFDSMLASLPIQR
ncbi:hypothetical protein LOC71_23370 [Rhodopirellula sp. JC740]|uniref:Uncharacterized protein n=1 Tax=Rhodopirellula halodulae TaxID=2894198 RepID=A0ABS8NNW9_9BACT|nr:hypothetical protein [Rhodopirellula sp. JC740]MCC9645230.1 hypothetical protein [Rhodopirellula sp. JC740]